MKHKVQVGMYCDYARRKVARLPLPKIQEIATKIYRVSKASSLITSASSCLREYWSRRLAVALGSS